MRRFLALVFVLSLAIPAGISLEGCTRNPGANYCNGLGFGLKDTDVASITLNPVTAGISMSYGQTSQVQTPSALTCKGETVSVNSNRFAFGTSNNQIVDLSPEGAICAGTWNRNTGGGIADYTVCNAPSPLPSSKGLPYAVAFITASANSVTSNPVAVYVHAPITSVALSVSNLSSGSTGQQCYSQTQVAQLDAEACYSVGGVQYELCAPSSVVNSHVFACSGGVQNGVTLQACPSTIGTLSFSLGNTQVGTINAATNQITAASPGTTVVNASIAQTASSAGYFSTCPPASISLALANGSTTGTVTQGVPQNLTTTVTDTAGHTITGLALSYQSTNQIDITANTTGAISATFPGVASVTALCQPSTCNPSPTNEIGLFGTGLPLSSNPVNITVPGTASDFAWFAAPGTSEYFAPIELLTGTLGSTVRMPYVPNSMIMDRNGANLYFGSARELMVYSTSTNGIETESSSVPGVVLAVSPDGSTVLINDQVRHVFYLNSIGGSGATTFSGMGNAAQWTTDSQTLYVTDNSQLNTPVGCGNTNINGHTDTLYIYNKNTGWSTYPLPASPLPASQIPPCTAQPNVYAPTQSQTPAVMVPSVGAYLRGSSTIAHTWCPSGTVGGALNYFPQGDIQAVESDSLASTVEGHHILGAQLNGGGTITLNDIAVTIPPNLLNNGTPAACPQSGNTMTPLNIASTVTSRQLGVSNVATLGAVVTGSTPVPPSGGVGSSLAFVTYSGTATGASLPFYLPAAGAAAGTPGTVTLNGAASITGPVAGAFSPDNTLFFVSTAGDNKIHYISIPNVINGSSQPVDSQQISPNLPACVPGTDTGCTYTGSGTVVPATVIAVKPRSTT